MKRVLIFSLAYYPHVGGAEVAIKEITDRIAPSDIEFHMLTLRFSRDDKQEEKIGNVFVSRVGRGGAYFSKILFVPMAALAARRLHKKNNFDAAWAMMSYMTLPLTLTCLRLPYVLTLQEGDTYHHMYERLRVLPLLPLLNCGFRRASVVQPISTYLGGWALKRGFTGPIEIIPNGVDVKKFSGSRIAHDGIVLIHTGRLVYKNGIDSIVRALSLLPQHIRLRLVGSGVDEQKLRTLARELNVLSRIEFAGFFDNDRLPEQLHAADIFVRPSRSEGMGISFVEAMAAGLPVVATQEGGIADFLFDAKRNIDKPTTGWAVDKDSPEQIATAVQDILTNPEGAALVVETAKKMVTEKYDWDLITKDMREKIFARLIKTG